MKKIIYVTGNSLKFEVAQNAIKGSDFSLIRQDLDVPEMQSENVEEIALFSAKWASDYLQRPVAVTDAGYYIATLNGFPGPFIKFINKWLTAEDILNLMRGKENRDVEVKACLAYCEPENEPVVFSGIFRGKIALLAGQKGTTSINEVFIPDGFDRPESEIPWEEMKIFWGKDDTWQKLIDYLKSRK